MPFQMRRFTSEQRENRGRKNRDNLAKFFLFKFRFDVAREGFTVDELKEEYDGFEVEKLIRTLIQLGYVRKMSSGAHVVTEAGFRMPDPKWEE